MVSGASPDERAGLRDDRDGAGLADVIIALPSLCVSMSASSGSETLHFTFFTPVTTAGILNSCVPSNAEYIFGKWISRLALRRRALAAALAPSGDEHA